MSEIDVKSSTRGEIFLDVFSGLGLGLLVGVMVGLSLSPVVSVVIGALAALLAAFLGLEQKGEAGGVANLRMNALRIGTFGFATVVGLILALLIRITEPFSEPLEQHVQRWVDAGYKEDALEIVLYERTGLLPKGKTVSVAVTEAQQKKKMSVLFSEGDRIDYCEILNPGRYNNRVEELIGVYSDQENETLKQIADELSVADVAAQKAAFNALYHMACEFQPEE